MKTARHLHWCIVITLGLLLVGGTGIARAQDYPTLPVILVVPWPAGGTTDIGMRALAAATEKYLNQKIVIENRPGAAGVLGPQQVAQNAAPDGYTLGQIPITVVRYPFMRKTTLDPEKDFTYIIGISGYTFGVVVRNDAPWKTFQEFLAYAKANPGKINYGTPARLRGGHIDAVADASGWGPLVNSGQLRLLVIWNAARSKNYPDVPTLRETGVDLVSNSPFGIAGPKDMDPKIVKILHDAFKKGADDPSYIASMVKLDQEPAYMSSDAYRRYARETLVEQKKLIEDLGLKQD